MSLTRMALRLAALNALTGAADDTAPTMAQNRVYDSRISDFSPETYPDDAKPTIVILTDDDEGETLSRQNGGPPFKRFISLVFEFAMVQGIEMAVVDPITKQPTTAFVPGFPATDAEHEASLDFLEWQILRRLAYDLSSAPALFRKISRSWKSNCHRQVLDDTGVKIAARVLTLVTEVSDDQEKVYRQGDTLPTGLNVLPDPLRTVALSLPAGSSALATVSAIAAKIAPLTTGPFKGMDLTYKASVGAGITDPADQFTGTADPPQT